MKGTLCGVDCRDNKPRATLRGAVNRWTPGNTPKIPTHDNQEFVMKLADVKTSEGRVIFIETDERLDLSAHSVFVQACKLAEYPNLLAIMVNLGKTRDILDSGLAMLLMLRERANHISKSIKLFNCTPEIRNRLLDSRVMAEFQIV